ncbi:hypothetical protein PsorP6_011756 [Peronosclerospora sorghi]|uniref:Uncharacterized protein n=1 Tax=Peronosclerospora sorghi TaxID=230839 RepID=A0ACC0WKE7_9STRA|nr:hypothetical protein PsorP6_011756 [Peronosclerospora sorghi]
MHPFSGRAVGPEGYDPAILCRNRDRLDDAASYFEYLKKSDLGGRTKRQTPVGQSFVDTLRTTKRGNNVRTHTLDELVQAENLPNDQLKLQG